MNCLPTGNAIQACRGMRKSVTTSLSRSIKTKNSGNKQYDKEAFYHRQNRIVRTDSTITLFNKVYEVPAKYIKQHIIVKYNPEDLSELFVYDDKNNKLETIKPVDAIANSNVKRNSNKTVKFSKGDN